MISKLQNIVLHDGSSKFKDLKRSTEIGRYLNAQTLKDITKSIDSNARHQVAHPELSDSYFLGEALQIERSGVSPNFSDADLANVSRRTVTIILLVDGCVQATALLREIISSPTLTTPPGAQLRIHQSFHDLTLDDMV